MPVTDVGFSACDNPSWSSSYCNWICKKMYMQSVPITTKVVSSIPAHGNVYSIKHYVIKFVSDFRYVDSFLWVIRIPPPIKLKI